MFLNELNLFIHSLMIFFSFSKVESNIWTGFQCSRCNQHFETYALLLDHDSNGCEYTEKFVFIEAEDSDDYKDYEDYLDKRKPQCPECNKKFASKRYLQTHLNYVHKHKDPEPLTCTVCSKTFIREIGLKNHMTRVHLGIVDYFKCEFCDKKFSTKMALKNHQRVVHFKNFSYHCEHCGKGFLYISALNAHKNQNHEGDAHFLPCPEEGCEKSFKARDSLRYHIEACHGTSQSICDQCGRIFTNMYLYKKHLRNHELEGNKKLYKCEVCDKEVTTKMSLQAHTRIHTGEKPFPCSACDQKFKTRSHLITHSVVHTKEKPFPCKVCGKGFTQRGSRKAHMKKCHV